ncbi:MAG: hypothetical protein U0228_11405 [Myxococcaceae bacterium]
MKLFSKRLENPKTGKVLQIYVDGTRVQLIRFKKNSDAPAEDELVQLKTNEAAMQTANRFIEAQFKKGYVDVSGPKPELELKKGEDPREALKRFSSTASREDLERFTERHAKALFGTLAPHWNVELIEAQWKDGALDALAIVPPDDSGDVTCHELTRAVLALPIAERVRELTFGVAGYTKHGATDDWSRTFSAVCAAPAAAGLTRLAFDYAADETVPPLESIVIGDLSAGFERLSSLESLSFRGHGLSWANATLPKLKSLKWKFRAFAAADVTALLSAKLPALDRLELMGEVDDAIAAQLLDGLARCAPACTVQLSARKLEATTESRLLKFNTRPKIRRRQP